MLDVFPYNLFFHEREGKKRIDYKVKPTVQVSRFCCDEEPVDLRLSYILVRLEQLFEIRMRSAYVRNEVLVACSRFSALNPAFTDIQIAVAFSCVE